MKRYFYFVDDYTVRFLTVLETSMEMKFLAARLGEIEEQDSRREMSATEIAENVEKAFEHGYREVNVEDFKSEQAKQRSRLEKTVVDAISPDAKLVSWKELRTKEPDWFLNKPEEFLSNKMQWFCVFDKPFHATEDLKIRFDSTGPSVQSATRNLVFNQGLRIDGNIDAGDSTSDLPMFILVKGDLHAKNLILTGWVEFVVTGNVVLDECLIGLDGETGGRLHVLGNLTSKRILGGSMFSIKVKGQTKGEIYWCDDDHSPFPQSIKVPSSLTQEQASSFEKHTALVRGAYYEDINWASGEEVHTQNIVISQIVELVRQGKPLFHSL